MSSFEITRRNSVKMAAVSWLAAHVPLRATALEASLDSYALNPLQPWVATEWKMPSGTIDAFTDQKFRFGLMNWSYGRKAGVAVRRAGQYEVIRRVLPDQIQYEWSLDRYFYSAGGTVTCHKSSQEPVLSWGLREVAQQPRSGEGYPTETHGQLSGRIAALASLLVSPASSRYWLDETRPFEYTESGVAVLNDYRLERDRETEKTLPDEWASLLLTGCGSLPRHLLRDERDRPLFFTALGLNYVLEEVENV